LALTILKFELLIVAMLPWNLTLPYRASLTPGATLREAASGVYKSAKPPNALALLIKERERY
jgi:hypothetical protein